MKKEIKQVVIKLDLNDEIDKKINDFLNQPLTNKTITIKKALLAYMDNEKPLYTSKVDSPLNESSVTDSEPQKDKIKGFNGGFSKDF